MRVSRRRFLTGAMSSATIAVAAGSLAQMPGMDHAEHDHAKPKRPNPPRLPALICRVSNTIAIDAAFAMLASGGDPLAAALHLSTAAEDDPNDHSTGRGALPNREGEVLLDACCFDGRTRRAAAVGSVNGIRNAALLASKLMQSTGDGLRAGPEAQAFALAHGFRKEDLLTERAREVYAVWKEINAHPELLGNLVGDPSWPKADRDEHLLPRSQKELDQVLHQLEPLAALAGLPSQSTWRAVYEVVTAPEQPLCVAVIDARGQLACAASSGGRPWRRAGAASDVATLGAGCFLDADVGCVVSSGTAEANLRTGGAGTVVDNMRRGMSAEDAGMDVLRRIAHAYKNDPAALRFVEMTYYMLGKDGTYASVSLWEGDKTGHVRQFTIMDAKDVRRTENCVSLFSCSSLNGCPASSA